MTKVLLLERHFNLDIVPIRLESSTFDIVSPLSFKPICITRAHHLFFDWVGTVVAAVAAVTVATFWAGKQFSNPQGFICRVHGRSLFML